MRKLLFVLAVCLGASAASAANNLNQYTTITRSDGTVANLTYDRNGNLTGDGTWTYIYDPENHLISATKPGTTAIYAYDPLGRRVSKTVHGVKTLFLWDGDTLLAEYDAGGHLIRAYAPGPRAADGGADYVAMLNATHDPALTELLFENHQGSIVATVNAAGNRVEGPLTYDAYGLPCGASGTHCPPSTPPGVPFRFTGMYYDAETGLYYDHARYYSPVLGRFLQTDPVGYGPDLNLYSYSKNDPQNKSDPTGEDVVDCDRAGSKITCTVTKDSSGTTTVVVTTHQKEPDGSITDKSTIQHFKGSADSDQGSDLTNAFKRMGITITAIGIAGPPGQRPTSPGQLQKQVERGQAPREIDRVDKGRGPYEKDHVELRDGRALNSDGTWKHGSGTIPGAVKDWLIQNGWTPPK